MRTQVTVLVGRLFDEVPPAVDQRTGEYKTQDIRQAVRVLHHIREVTGSSPVSPTTPSAAVSPHDSPHHWSPTPSTRTSDGRHPCNSLNSHAISCKAEARILLREKRAGYAFQQCFAQ